MSEKRVSFASKNETHEYTPAAAAKGAGASHAPSPVPCELTSASESRKRGRPADGAVDKARKAVKKVETRWLEAEIILSDAKLKVGREESAGGVLGQRVAYAQVGRTQMLG